MKVSVTALVACAATVAASPAFADARSDAKSQVAFGINVAQRGLWREAIYRWEKAAELDPTYAAAFNDLAIAYEHEGQLDKARKAYEKALELDPNNSQIRQNYELFKEINDRTSPGQREVVSPLAAVAACAATFALACGPDTTRSRSRRRSSRSWTCRRSSACWSPASSPAAPRMSTPTRKRSACCAASSAPSRR